MRRTRIRRLLALVLAVLLAWAGYELWHRQRGLTRAIELAQFGLLDNARGQLAGYLQLHPGDSRARFMMAELWANDDELLVDKSVPAALIHLQQIPDDSPLAPQARTLQAKLEFLVQHRPVAAERLLRQAIELDEDHREAHQVLCTLMDMTGRYHDYEPLFWRTYQLTPDDEKAVRLRAWYMSQFFPLSANDELDRQMGFEPRGPLPTEAVRYLRFRETEPNEPLARAALARWASRVGKPGEALSMLDVDNATSDNELQDPFYVATLIDLLIDLGEYDQAQKRLEQWPGPRESFDYWRLEAILLEELHGKYDAALDAYDRALQVWPGPAKWRLLHRKAGCLARAERREEAVAARQRAKVVEQLMQNDVHERLRHVLGFLDDPEPLQEVVEFYRQLGRTREADAWSREVARRVADQLD